MKPNQDDDDDQQLAEHIREERHRGKRGVLDLAEQKRRRREVAAFLKAARECDYEGFVEVLRGIGIDPDTPRFAAAISVWYQYKRG